MKKLFPFFIILVVMSCGTRDESQETPPGNDQQITTTGQAVYRAEFTGKWDASRPNDAPTFPSNGHFTPFVFISHNNQHIFWTAGAKATAGMELLAEAGQTSTLIAEANTVSQHVMNVFVATSNKAGDAQSLWESKY